MFTQIDPNFKLSGKFEDEVIAMFKQLKYPYQISKTSLVAVGTPATWPALLATIMWLIELLGYDEAVMVSNQMNIDDTNDDSDVVDVQAATEKAFFRYLGTAYQLFINAEDEACDELEKEYIGSFVVKNNSIINQIHSLEERNALLEKEIADVQGRRAYLPDLQSKKLDYAKDIDKFKSLIQQLLKHKEQLEVKSRDRRIELGKLQGSVNAVLEEIEELKMKIATQGIITTDDCGVLLTTYIKAIVLCYYVYYYYISNYVQYLLLSLFHIVNQYQSIRVISRRCTPHDGRT